MEIVFDNVTYITNLGTPLEKTLLNIGILILYFKFVSNAPNGF